MLFTCTERELCKIREEQRVQAAQEDTDRTGEDREPAEGDCRGMSPRCREVRGCLSAPVGLLTKLPAPNLGLSVPVPATPQQGRSPAPHSPALPGHGSY